MKSTRQFLLTMWEGGGTVPPQLGVARRLLEAGHRVHVLGDPTIGDRAQAIGCDFTSWETPPHRTTLDPDDDVFKDWEASNPLVMLRNARDRFMAGPAGLFAAETAAIIESIAPDAVLADGMILGSMVAAQAAGLPTGVLMPNIWMLPTPGLTPVGPGFEPARSVLGRMRDSVVRRMATRIFDGGLPALNAARAAHGLAPLAHLWDQVLTCNRIFVLTSATFDFGSVHVPDHALYLGPILDDPAWIEPHDWVWRDPELPLVAVGLSSTYQDQVGLLRRIVDALDQLPVRAVVTTGQMVDPKDISTANPDIEVVASASHTALFAEADLVVTHCGHGTTMKALAAGTPMVCIPMGRDQNDTAVRVVHAGAGTRLTPRASTDRIRDAVSAALSSEPLRDGAARMARTIADEIADAETVREIVAFTTDDAPIGQDRQHGTRLGCR